VYDRADVLAFTIFTEQRIEEPLSEISPNLVHALVAIEDLRFYDHHGFDPFRIVSAGFANIRHRRAVQGGSTLTQQLARQSFLTPDKTLRRKLQELILAGRLERLYSKDRILELYANKVYFGDGLYGVEAASRGYLGKHASELTVADAALLAGLVKSPSTYAPTASMSRAVARRNLVLQAMLDSGFIDRAAWQSARATHVALRDSLRAKEPHGEYFKEQVRRELVERFGWQRVYQGGLHVFSTIDMPMQIAAESAVTKTLKAIDEKRHVWLARRHAANGKIARPPTEGEAEPLQAALVSLEPQTGHVRAMIGGRDFNDSRFNRAVQAHRQPGSAFKPFVYAAALEAGYTPATVLDHLNAPIQTLQGAWTPEEGHSTAESMSLRTALRTSSNRAAVRLLHDVGIPRTVQYARDMGIGEMPSVPSLALGSGEVTLQSLTAAYAGFANHGIVPRPILIRRVEDRDGRVLYEAHDSSTRAISDTTAFLMTNMMADVVNAGTGARARQLGFTLPAAGKTGTTNDFNDAWFVGFTPKLVAGVWVGLDQPHTILPHGFAADIAVPVWAKFMQIATRGDKPEWYTPPPGVTMAMVCRLSGKLATEGCRDVELISSEGAIERRSMVYSEYFARGTEPLAYCDLHPTHGIVGSMASLLGGEEKPAPPKVDDPGLPPSVTATTDVVVEPGLSRSPQEPGPRRKRGFWSKLLGIGKDKDEADTPEDLKPAKKN
jgi:penicillin-binding protein 1A